MGYTTKQPKPLYPDWSTIRGIVQAVYEKSLIYRMPVGMFSKKVRIPLSVCKGMPKSDEVDIQVAGWFASKSGFK